MSKKITNLLSKLISALTVSEITGSPVSYTTGTANTWTKHGNFTIPKSGLYRVKAPFINSAVTGLGFSSTSATSVTSATITENAFAAGIDVTWWMDAGTYALWTKCSSASKSNNVRIYAILVQ